MDSESCLVGLSYSRTKVLSNLSEGVTYCWRLESKSVLKKAGLLGGAGNTNKDGNPGLLKTA